MSYSEKIEKILNPLPKEFSDIGLSFEGCKEFVHSDGSKFRRFLYVNHHSMVTLEISPGEEIGSMAIFISHPAKGSFENHIDLSSIKIREIAP